MTPSTTLSSIMPTPAATWQPFCHATPLGPMASIWSEQGLFSLGWTDEPTETRSSMVEGFEQRAGQLDDALGEYFQTGHADFRDIVLDTDGWTDFTKRVYQRCREIEPGTTVTYKQLATRSGNASASRAVGAAMARNRALLVIPCHRVVSGNGSLRGFSAPGGLQTKQFLLDLESE